MTNKEAISILERMQDPEAWEPQVSEKMFTALQMGIDALKMQLSIESTTFPVDGEPLDCISRQQAIDAILREYNADDPDFPTYYQQGLSAAKKIIEQLPSAQTSSSFWLI